MFKFSWILSAFTTSAEKRSNAWRHDPLGHPDIRSMNPRELADLVIPPEATQSVARSACRATAIAGTSGNAMPRGWAASGC